MACLPGEEPCNDPTQIRTIMPRPSKCRTLTEHPVERTIHPSGRQIGDVESVTMSYDEFEAIRLADLEGLYQEDAARLMQVSRPTFSNILASARRKLGEMLVLGKSLTVTGGNIMVTSEERMFGCASCGHQWAVPFGTGRPGACPSCSGENIHRLTPGGGFGGGRRGGGRCKGYRTGLNGPGCCEPEGQGRGRGRGACHGHEGHGHHGGEECNCQGGEA